MFTRQHYKAIAEIIRFNRENLEGAIEDVDVGMCIAHDLADYFADDNSRFDRKRFCSACDTEV